MRFKRKKFAILSLVLIIIMTMQGCYSYRDINKITFVTNLVFDKNEIGDLDIYLDCVKPYRSANESSDKGKRIVYKGTGKTILEAIRDVNMMASNEINFTQCKAYIFTEKAAKDGIKKYVDSINRMQQFMIRPYMFVLFGSADELLNQVQGDEEYLGTYIQELVGKMDKDPRIIATSTNDYLDNRTMKDIEILGALTVEVNEGQKRLELSGGALFKDEVMVRKLTPNEGITYNLLKGKTKSGTLEAINPQKSDSFVTLDITKTKTKTSIDFDGSRIKLIKDIKLKCYLAESQDLLDVNKETLKTLEEEEQVTIEQYSRLLFDMYKKDDLDAFGVAKMFKENYPDIILDVSPVSITDIEVNVDVKIQGSSITSNTF